MMINCLVSHKSYQQVARERRERWTAKRMELIGYRVFPPWTQAELAEAQIRYDRFKIQFWRIK